MKRRDKLDKRYSVLSRIVDDSAEDLWNNNFTEFELELAISQIKPAKSTFDGEVEAIKVALTHLNARPPLSDQSIIFLDSQAAILTIANNSQAPSSMSVMQCRSLMGKMHERLLYNESHPTAVSPIIKTRMAGQKKLFG
ncbi:hypothetical protein NPIL_606551 [Nephila pilipes]|uniref:Uncharacterized protein n=1 Tax=Nephila pilipes TaxID=299642 RepID=A0A8X6MFX7_NEPPI|nr:hypothetical protein NPIL_606551 [Nephila pilipes]